MARKRRYYAIIPSCKGKSKFPTVCIGAREIRPQVSFDKSGTGCMMKMFEVPLRVSKDSKGIVRTMPEYSEIHADSISNSNEFWLEKEGITQ